MGDRLPSSRESTLSVEDGWMAGRVGGLRAQCRTRVRGPANEMGGHEQGQGGERELEGALGARGSAIPTPTSTPSGERTPIIGRLAQADVAVAALAGGADQGDDHDHQQRGRLAFDLAEAEEDVSAGTKRTPPPTPTRPPARPPARADEDGEDLVHRHALISGRGRSRSRPAAGRRGGDGALGDPLLDRGADRPRRQPPGSPAAVRVTTWTLP